MQKLKGIIRAIRPNSKFELFLLMIIAFGLLARISTFWLMEPGTSGDPGRYATMGYSFKENGDFTMPYGEIPAFPGRFNFTPSMEPEYSHHFSPGYPIYLAIFYQFFGFSVEITKIASIISSILLIIVVFITTNDLYGKRSAFIVTAIISLDFNFIKWTGLCHAENLVAIFFVLTIWAILRSLKEEKYIILAGIFAGLGYLTKSSIGYFFIVAGSAGFLWRFYYMKWDVFKNKSYLIAIFVFFCFVGIWALRNIIRFGWPNWETSPYTTDVTNHALSHMGDLLYTFGIKIFFFISILLTYMAFWIKSLKKSLGKIKDEEYSGIWLAIFLPTLLGLIFASIYHVWEQLHIYWYDNVRYVMIVFVPIMWLVIRTTNFDKKPCSLANIISSMKISTLVKKLKEFRFNLKFLIFIALLFTSVIVFFIIQHHIWGIIIFIGAVAFFIFSNNKILLCCMVFAFLIADVNLMTTYQNEPVFEMGDDLRSIVNEGDRIALIGGIDYIYDLYYSIHDKDVILELYNRSSQYDHIICFGGHKNLTGYEIVSEYYVERHYGVVENIYLKIRNHFLVTIGTDIEDDEGAWLFAVLYS